MQISRGFAYFDHAELGCVQGLVTLIGGKATIMQAIAEQTADLNCRKTRLIFYATKHGLPLLLQCN